MASKAKENFFQGKNWWSGIILSIWLMMVVESRRDRDLNDGQFAKKLGVVDDCNKWRNVLSSIDIFPFPLDENCLKFWILFPSHSISSKISFSRKGKLVVIDEKREASRREKEEQRIETGNGIGSFHYLFNTPTPNNNLADAIIDRNLYSACCYFISRRQRHRCRAIIAADNEQLRLQSLPSTHYHLSARAFIIRSNEIVSVIIRTI